MKYNELLAQVEYWLESARTYQQQRDAAEAKIVRLQAVIEKTHANGYGHMQPWEKCPARTCTAARRELEIQSAEQRCQCMTEPDADGTERVMIHSSDCPDYLGY